MKQSKTKVFFFEEHPLMILGVTALINNEKDMELCGSSSNPSTVVEEIQQSAADAIVLDISLYTSPSIEFIRTIAKEFPDRPITVLSIHKEAGQAEKAAKAGARAYLLKVEDPLKLVEAIRATMDGKQYLSEMIVGKEAPRQPPSDSPINTLSQRQFKILQQIGKGYNNRQISEMSKLSPRIVDEEVANIRKKLDLEDATELLQFAIHWVHHEGGFA